MAVSDYFYSVTVNLTQNSKSVQRSGGTAWSPLPLQPGMPLQLLRTGLTVPGFVDVVTDGANLELTDNFTGQSGPAVMTVLLLPMDPIIAYSMLVKIQELFEAVSGFITGEDYTAEDVLAKLLTVDGINSGLDADKVRNYTPGGVGLDILQRTSQAGAMTALGISGFMQTVMAAATSPAARSVLGADNATNLIQDIVPDARVSATLTADKAFRRGNILGTVSQSGGVPTGALFERNSNANGAYTRLPDGTQFCFKSVAVAASVLAKDFTFASAGNWPAAFSALPFTVLSYVGANADKFSAGANSVNSGSAGTAYLRNVMDASAGANGPINFISLGRWF